jgi:hypothetical protein
MCFTRNLSLPCLLLLLTVGSLRANDLSAPDIVALMASHNERRAANLIAYRSTRVYQLDYSGFPSSRHAKMTATVHFQAGKKTFAIVSEDGSKMLLNRILHRLLESEQEASDRENQEKTALTERNYDFALMGRELIDGRQCYILQVKPKRDNKFLYDGRIWVDAQDFAVVRIEAQPAKNPSFWISQTTVEHHYLKRGEFWLPASNRSSSKVRLGGRAVLTIDYGRYEVINGQDSHETRAQATVR